MAAVEDIQPDYIIEEEDRMFYLRLVQLFKQNGNRAEIISELIDFCRLETTTPLRLYVVKKEMEINFATHVHCSYALCNRIIGKWSDSSQCGCDLREIIFNKDGQLNPRGEELLELFEKKKHVDSWHILTDIDDTLFPHSAFGFAGTDKSWIDSRPYPGITSFYDNFYSTLHEEYRYSTLLSATPYFKKSSRLNNPLIRGIIGPYGFIHGSNSIADQFFDRVKDTAIEGLTVEEETALHSQLYKIHKSYGKLKYNRCIQYLRIFPEYKIIFIGDDGQGDVYTGIRMIRTLGNRRCIVFIHKVCEKGFSLFTIPCTLRDNSRMIMTNNLYYFTNYAQVASILYQQYGLFNHQHVVNVLDMINSDIEKSTILVPKNYYSVDPSVFYGKKCKSINKQKNKRKSKNKRNSIKKHN